ncbi:MAG TPA: glycoside hydrolase family 5 protein [Candidatus Saccharimonadales bacterium]|jgi:glucan 1,3-beta-glucosidase
MEAKPLAGVNLGGWLVLESWITPSLFRGTDAEDEYTFCKQAGADELKRLKHFRDTFITRPDFEWLAAHGIQAVRLPVGYWMFGDAAPYAPTVSYVDKAFQWAQETGIRVLIDLHGAPGSQNGWDHSGQKGHTGWGHNADDIPITLKVIRMIAKRYGKHPALLGISLLNEPSPLIPKTRLLDYYKEAYATVRELCGDDVWVVYSDGYLPWRWRRELPRGQFKQALVDTHRYQVFSPLDKLLPAKLNLLRTRWLLPRSLVRLRKHHPIIVGEWSLTLGNSSRNPAASRHGLARTYAQLQLRAFRPMAAWFFWTYRTEDDGTWSFRDCVETGRLESPGDVFQTPDAIQ